MQRAVADFSFPKRHSDTFIFPFIPLVNKIMIKTLKTVLAVAVTFSIVTISGASANAIKKWSDGEFSLSALSAKEREKELK